jgi:hypothetical protein
MAENTWVCPCCGLKRTDTTTDCPHCGLKAGTPQSDIIRMPLSSLGMKTKTVILVLPLISWIFAFMYSLIENFAPSDQFFLEYGAVVWGPWSLGYLMVGARTVLVKVHNSTQGFKSSTSRLLSLLKSIGRLLIALMIVLPCIYVTSIYGAGPLINRIVGEPFQARSLVKGKYWSRNFGPTLTLDNSVKTLRNKVLTSKEVFQTVKEGDTVTISGVESLVGRSIYQVIPISKDF